MIPIYNNDLNKDNILALFSYCVCTMIGIIVFNEPKDIDAMASTTNNNVIIGYFWIMDLMVLRECFDLCSSSSCMFLVPFVSLLLL